MNYDVRQVRDHKQAWKDFLALPHSTYRDDGNWAAPLPSEVRKALDDRNNPYYERAEAQSFVCYRNGAAVARLAVVINRRHWERWGGQAAFFGFFEAADDPAAVRLLFDEAEAYAAARGANTMEGPFNPHHYAELGLLVQNFAEAPRFFETYNPPYYVELLEEAGYREIKRLHARINRNTADYVNEHYRNIAHLSRPSEFTIRPFRLRQMKAELERIREINNDAFYDNWHFLPLSQAEYAYASRYLFLVTRPSLVLIVEKGDEPVGVIQCMLNINQALRPLQGKVTPWSYLRLLKDRLSIREIIIYAIGIKKAYRHSFVIRLMLDEMIRIVQKYPVVSTSWMTNENIPAVQASLLLGLQPYKQFAIYGKALRAKDRP